jgi:hypothetical protein
MLTNLPMAVYGRLLIRHTDAEGKQTEHGRILIRMMYIFQVPQRPYKGERKEHDERHQKTGRFNSSTGIPAIGQSCCPEVGCSKYFAIPCYGGIIVVENGIQVER